MNRFLLVCTTLLIACALVPAGPASAEVRFGKNVRVGGHDVSGQTFNSKRRGLFIIYEGKPKNEGCRWRNNKDGSRTKVCHWQRKK